MNFESTIDAIAKNVEKNVTHDDSDYILDGIVYCGNCNEPKQTRFSVPSLNIDKIVPCICKCRKEELEKEEQEREYQKKLQRIARMRISGIQDEKMREWTFENSDPDKENPNVKAKALRYCEKWDEMYSNNIGLLFFGNKGTGKTRMAANIANNLINKGVPVLMTSFTKIIKDLTGFKIQDKNGYVNSLNNYELLIIDDLGVERESDFALEQVFDVIDTRYRNGQPLIVTTNLSVEDLKNAQDIKLGRIYDRILEMTVPIKVDGVSIREQLHKDKLKLARELFAD